MSFIMALSLVGLRCQQNIVLYIQSGIHSTIRVELKNLIGTCTTYLTN